jgi:hypothetical protein
MLEKDVALEESQTELSAAPALPAEVEKEGRRTVDRVKAVKNALAVMLNGSKLEAWSARCAKRP